MADADHPICGLPQGFHGSVFGDTQLQLLVALLKAFRPFNFRERRRGAHVLGDPRGPLHLGAALALPVLALTTAVVLATRPLAAQQAPAPAAMFTIKRRDC